MWWIGVACVVCAAGATADVRGAAVQQTRLGGGALFEDDDENDYAVGTKVFAYWEEDNEWY